MKLEKNSLVTWSKQNEWSASRIHGAHLELVKRLRNNAVGRSCVVSERSSLSPELFWACLEQYWLELCELRKDVDDRERFKDNKELGTSFGDVKWFCSQPQLNRKTHFMWACHESGSGKRGNRIMDGMFRRISFSLSNAPILILTFLCLSLALCPTKKRGSMLVLTMN